MDVDTYLEEALNLARKSGDPRADAIAALLHTAALVPANLQPVLVEIQPPGFVEPARFVRLRIEVARFALEDMPRGAELVRFADSSNSDYCRQLEVVQVHLLLPRQGARVHAALVD